MKKIFIKRIILIIFILIWMFLVFGLSNQNSIESSGLSLKISKILTRNNLEKAKLIAPYIRKIAHFSEYGVGGILFTLLFFTFEKIYENKVVVFSLLVGIAYAISDELHQLFIPGRAGKIFDVYIDTLGVFTGILFILLVKSLVNLAQNHSSQLKS